MEAIMNLKKELSLAETNKELLITELDQKNSAMILQILEADKEVARLKLEVTRLENSQLAVTINLQGAPNEIGGLSIIVDQHG
jgi:hypothetical protein